MSEDKIAYNTTPALTEAAAKTAVRKGKKAVEKNTAKLERLEVTYIAVDRITPNTYNPNRQSEHDSELLLKSMSEDGFTQPVVGVIDPNNAANVVIVDGEHRWRAARTLGYAEIPVVITPMTPEQARIATLRHNRARGSEDVELEAQVLRDLQSLGALDHAQDSLMLDDVELNRLLNDLKPTDELPSDDYGEAWEPDSFYNDDVAEASTQARTIQSYEGVGIVTAATGKAVEDIRQRESRLKAARTEQERQTIRNESKIFRVSLIFSDDEAIVVEKALGDEPAKKLLELCQKVIDG
jgi:hypothetical protein